MLWSGDQHILCLFQGQTGQAKPSYNNETKMPYEIAQFNLFTMSKQRGQIRYRESEQAGK